MNSKITIGTVIHGTLRNEDLLNAFADELGRVGGPADDTQSVLLADARSLTETESEIGSEIVNELIDALNGYAPPHVYFGALEGDGADFGWWPTGEPFELCDTTVTKSPSYLDQQTEWIDNDCGVIVQINDHGNVTVMDMNRNEIWSAV